MRMDGIGEHLILKCEKLHTSGAISDCLIFSLSDLRIGVCEIKSKHLDIPKIEQQLTNGVVFALNIQRKLLPNFDDRVIPILLAKHYKKSFSIYKKLCDTKIKVECKKYSIIPKTCNTQFSHIVDVCRKFS